MAEANITPIKGGRKAKTILSTFHKLAFAAKKMAEAGIIQEDAIEALEELNEKSGRMQGDHFNVDNIPGVYQQAVEDAGGVVNARFIPDWGNNPRNDFIRCLEAAGIELRHDERTGSPQFRRIDEDGPWQRFDANEEAILRGEFWDKAIIRPAIDEDGFKAPLKGANFTAELWRNALAATALMNRTDPFLEWLEGLPEWDHRQPSSPEDGSAPVLTLDNLITQFFHTPGSSPEYVRWATLSIFIGAVARAYEPGRKHDEVVMTVGGQGAGKSTLWRCIMPHGAGWFGDNLNMMASDLDKATALKGKVIVECPELRGVRKTDAESIKAFLSRQYDEPRRLYSMLTEFNPRRTIIVGSTNDTTSLHNDPTGNRRFVPIDIRPKWGADTAGLIEYELSRAGVLEGLWAQALYIYRADGYRGIPKELIEEASARVEEHRSPVHGLEEEVLDKLEIYQGENIWLPQFIENNLSDLAKRRPRLNYEVAEILKRTRDRATRVHEGKKRKVWVEKEE